MDSGYYVVNTVNPELVVTNIYTISDRAARLVANGLQVGDVVSIEVYTGVAPSGSWGPLYRRGTQVVLTETNNQLLETFVGKYRAIYEGDNDVKVWQDSSDLDIDRTVNYIFPGDSGGSGNGFVLDVADTESVNLTFTGDSFSGQLSADVVLSALNPNTIQTLSDGLWVPPQSVSFLPNPGGSIDIDAGVSILLVVVCDSSQATCTLNLPNIQLLVQTVQIIIKNTDSGLNNQTIHPFGTDEIEGANADYVLAPGKAVILTNGQYVSGWWVVGGVP